MVEGTDIELIESRRGADGGSHLGYILTFGSVPSDPPMQTPTCLRETRGFGSGIWRADVNARQNYGSDTMMPPNSSQTPSDDHSHASTRAGLHSDQPQGVLIRWWQFRWSDWAQILRDTRFQVRVDTIPLVAAGVSFYAVLAVIPVAIILVTLYGLLTDPAEAERQIAQLIEILPTDAASLIGRQMRPLASSASGALSIGFVLSAFFLLWTSSNATKSMVRAVVIAYDEEESQSRFGGRIASFAITIAVLVFFLFVIAVVAVIPAWLSAASVTTGATTLRWAVLFPIALAASLVFYRYAPPRTPPAWGSLIPAAGLAASIWMVASAGFSYYVENFGAYNETYGILGGAVILMMWFFLSALAFLIGAELGAQLEDHVARDASETVPLPTAQG